MQKPFSKKQLKRLRDSFKTHERPISVSLITPPIRMVLITVGVENSEEWHYFTPIIAIESSVERAYYYEGDDFEDVSHIDTGGTEEELLERGWVLKDQWIIRRPIYMDCEGMIVAEGDDKCCNTTQTVVMCPWPPEEDEERLKDEIVHLLESLHQYIKYEAEED